MSEKGYEFEEFKKELADQIREHLPEEYKNGTIQFQEVTKSGLGEMTEMTIRTPDSRIAPCLYIDAAFEEHQKYGIPMSAIAEKIGKTFSEALVSGKNMTEDKSLKTLLSKGFEWDTVKESCFIKAVPFSDNAGYLVNLPHRQRLPKESNYKPVYLTTIYLTKDDVRDWMSHHPEYHKANKMGVVEARIFI